MYYYKKKEIKQQSGNNIIIIHLKTKNQYHRIRKTGQSSVYFKI